MSQIKLTADSGGGTTSLKAPSSTPSNADVVLKLPVADGSANQVLKTDGSGQLSFTSNAGTTINNNADNRIITGSGTASTLEGEANLTYNGNSLHVKGSGELLRLETTAAGGGQCYIDFDDETATRASIGMRGSSSDTLTIAALNSSLRFDVQNKTQAMNIDTDGNVLVGTTSTAPILKFGGSAVGFAVKGGQPTLAVEASANSDYVAYLGQAGTNSYLGAVGGGDLIFQLGTAGTERMRIESGGTVNIGTTSSDSDTQFLNIQAPQSAGKHSLHLQGHTSSSFSGSDVLKCVLHGYYRQSYGQNGFLFKNADDHTHNRGVRVHKYVRSDGNECGSIFYNSSSTSFNTSSDYRLKENEVLISDGITRIKQLKPYKFNFKGLSEVLDGFFAHEVAEVVPQAVGGVKDEMKPNDWYKEGDEIPSGKSVGDVKGYSSTEMEIQQLDYSKLVPLLTAALQEAVGKIETLETKVAALEGA